jgi:hypothetical protein
MAGPREARMCARAGEQGMREGLAELGHGGEGLGLGSTPAGVARVLAGGGMPRAVWFFYFFYLFFKWTDG